MEKSEAKSIAKALYLQSAGLAGFEVSPDSPESLAAIVDGAFPLVKASGQAEATANLLRLIALTIEEGAKRKGQKKLFETDVKAAQLSLCPVYPYGKPKKRLAR